MMVIVIHIFWLMLKYKGYNIIFFVCTWDKYSFFQTKVANSQYERHVRKSTCIICLVAMKSIDKLTTLLHFLFVQVDLFLKERQEWGYFIRQGNSIVVKFLSYVEFDRLLALSLRDFLQRSSLPSGRRFERDYFLIYCQLEFWYYVGHVEYFDYFGSYCLTPGWLEYLEEN